jgi:hypothetical protein
LLGKWLARLLTEDGVWQQLLRKKYVGSKVISQVFCKPGDSHFWAGIMATKKHFFPFGYFSIKNGAEIRFWEDRWLGTTTLREQYPALYIIVQHKGDTLQKVMESSPPSMTFRCDLVGPRLDAWNDLLEWLGSIQLVQGMDEFRWSLTKMEYFRLTPCTKHYVSLHNRY